MKQYFNIPFPKLIDQADKEKKHPYQDLNTILNRYIKNSKPNGYLIHIELEHTWNMHRT